MFVLLSGLISETIVPIYKILSPPCSLKLEDGFRRKFEPITFNSVQEQILNAVSYTHLDVYKRQIILTDISVICCNIIGQSLMLSLIHI